MLQGFVNDPRKIFIVLFPVSEFSLSLSLCVTINLHSIKSTSRKAPSVCIEFEVMHFTYKCLKYSVVNKKYKRNSKYNSKTPYEICHTPPCC